MSDYYMGIDVGGSHISLSLVNPETGKMLEGSYLKQTIDPEGSATKILDCWQSLLNEALGEHGQMNIHGIGVAMPGPFDYKRGISKITGVQKYESLFGLNFKQATKHILKNGKIPVSFINDAEAYALGEYYEGGIQGHERTVFVSLGTGFGSAFLINGIPQVGGEKVPDNGYLYNWPVENGIADDKLSTRWFTQEWKKKTGATLDGVKELAEKARTGDAIALNLFDRFTENLSDLLIYWLDRFEADALAIGGNISRASDLFLDKLISKIKAAGLRDIAVCISELGEKAPVIGAAMSLHQLKKNRLETEIRKTTQQLIPERAPKPVPGKYNVYPGFPIGKGKIGTGHKDLSNWILQHKTVVIDGYVGVFWDMFMKNIDEELRKAGKKALWFHVDVALRPADEIDEMLKPDLGGDDPLFGKITGKKLSDWYDREKLDKIKPDENADINIVFGCGASLCGWQGALIYIDLPKNELQYRMRAGQATNLGSEQPVDCKQMYKRFYFVDWRVLNEHKNNLLQRIDLIVDEQRIDQYPFMSGEEMRKGLSSMSRNFFRVRPWFEPGVWGGTWMKEHMEALGETEGNLAWSYELMALENGLLFESGDRLLEVSFDFLMYNNHKDVLGDAATRFEYEFPIRFDFLDTFDGGNLSVQCHPSNEYIQEKFGMPFTQDETYYIMDCKEDAKVYLGFREGVDEEEFYNELIQSQTEAKEIDIPRFVQVFEAKKHELYLIPNGTIHASGKDNLVLEISSAPYIFTFKMYDWSRLDLDGKPRPINIEHGMNNLRFDRQGDVVSNELISKPYILEETDAYTLEHVPTHKEHFYDIHRYSFDREVKVQTGDKCHVWMLVEGSHVTLITKDGMEQEFNYAETFVVPAAADHYTLVNKGNKPAVMVKAFVK